MKSRLAWWTATVLLISVTAGALWWWQVRGERSHAPTVPLVAATLVAPVNNEEESGAPSTVPPEAMTNLVPCGAFSTRLLGREPLFNDNRIGIAMSAADGNAAVRVPCPEFTSTSVLALTSHGMETLSGDLTQADTSVAWGCGENFPAVTLRAQRSIEEGDVPLAVGTEAPKLLKWLPAKHIPDTVDCPPPEPGFTRKQQQLFEIVGRTGRWSLEQWELPEADATREGVPIYIDVWSNITAEGQCVAAARSEQDLDGKPLSAKPPLRSVYGLLLFEKGTVQKSWLLFNSPGYEGAGIAAAEVDPTVQQLTLEQADVVVYSGC